jgi:fatty-acyl-CoA synthase
MTGRRTRGGVALAIAAFVCACLAGTAAAHVDAHGAKAAKSVGVPHERWGEVGMAFVVADGVTHEELVDHCAARLARFKVPHSVRFVDAIPRNGLGKIQKQLLAVELMT